MILPRRQRCLRTLRLIRRYTGTDVLNLDDALRLWLA